MYENAGRKHTRGDVVVEWEESQKELNGHVAMILKIFRVGEKWGHVSRIREFMLGNGLTVCPITLLYKDHQGWEKSQGIIVLPTRHVAGGHVGMNLHLCELVSDITEPLAYTIEGGAEVISTEDLIA